jgi:hypothetical protein
MLAHSNETAGSFLFYVLEKSAHCHNIVGTHHLPLNEPLAEPDHCRASEGLFGDLSLPYRNGKY